MALQKVPLLVTFGQGLDSSTDKNQVDAGNFLRLENTTFDVGGLLKKRPGFPKLTTLPDATSTTLTTLGGNLLATGQQLRAYSADTNVWLDQGKLQPVDVVGKPLIRNSQSQVGPDSVTTSQGLTCLTYTESAQQYYQISDSNTGQVIVPRVALEVGGTHPRVFLLGPNFVITYMVLITATPHLRFIAVPVVNPTRPTAPADISTTVKSLNAGYDGFVANNTLYVSYAGSDSGGAIRTSLVTQTLGVSSPLITAGHDADRLTITADNSGTTPVLWIAWHNATTNNSHVMAISAALLNILAPVQFATGLTINELTSIAQSGKATIFAQVTNTVVALGSIRSDYVVIRTCTLAGTLSTAYTLARGVGLATKAYFGTATNAYVGLVYAGSLQPTYFISDVLGNVVAKLAYQNGGGYAATQVLPSVTGYNGVYYYAYLLKDLLVSVNKTQGAATSSGIYTQTGINQATISINKTLQYSSEIAGSLQLTGGFVWQYDSNKPVELGFHLYPEGLISATATTGGNLTAQQYYYSFCYEWTDAAGQLHRSAPSVPVGVVTTGTTSSNTVNVPTLRLTYKTGVNNVRLVGYRWSTGQQSYYQFTSISSPTINDTTVDFLAVTDTLADASILGNTLLYTTGSVLENIAAPPSVASTLYKNRMIVIDAEDRNLLWYSKQVLSNTPVEFTDLQTIYVAPTAGSQGSTGDCTALAAMDDKLIIFKQNAIYYVTGTGPDITGANNDFSDPVYITAAVGCFNPASIVLTPEGLMFESDKGIWLLARNLSTGFIGVNVQDQTNNNSVVSALSVPGTNEIRFALSNSTTIVFDYYYKQWATYVGISNISGTLYQGKHTILNNLGKVLQQSTTSYLDDTSPVLMAFTTAWLKVTGLQGLQRAYNFFMLSNYATPHKINIGVAYDYNASLSQVTTLIPSNKKLLYGSDTVYGGSSPFGGDSDVEQFRVFLDRQKCQSLSVTVSEVYDASLGLAAGAGLTISGLNFTMGGKKASPTLTAAQSKA